MLVLLLKAGANPNLHDKNGQTPLIWACSFGRSSLAKYLLEYGASVVTKDENGNTPLHLAANGEVAILLLNAGAEINQTNMNNETCIATATRDKRFTVLSVLTNYQSKILSH